MAVVARSLVAPPPGFSDIRYVSGIGGRTFREVLGPGDCCAADAPPRPPHAARRAPAPAAAPAGRRRRATGLDRAGAADREAAVRHRSRRSTSIAASSMWQVPHGDTPDNVRNHPALAGHEHSEDRPGRARRASGLMVTKTLVVMGDPQVTTTPEHPRGAMLRAYDKHERARKSARSGCRRRRADRR